MIESGVYKIVNKITNELYVGSTINLKRREYEHFHQLRKNSHSNNHLQHSFNKHGEDNFEFTILEICEKNKCLEIEQKHISELKPYYNINPTAGNSLGVKHSIETKDKISKTKMGHITSEETKEKISKSLKKSYSIRNIYLNHHIYSDEQKKQISQKRINHPTNIKRRKPIIQLTLNDEPIKEWNGCNEIMRELGYYAIHISRCCNGIKKTSYGFKWKYK